MSQMVQVSTVSTVRELRARYASARRAFFPPVRRQPPPRPTPVVVYVTPVEINRPPRACIVYDKPVEIGAMEWEEATIASMLGKRIRVADIIAATAEHFGIRQRDLLSQRRTWNVARPRQVVMFLAKDMTERSLPEIGRLVGGKDHTTVLHATRKIAALIEAGDPIAVDVAAIRARLLA